MSTTTFPEYAYAFQHTFDEPIRYGQITHLDLKIDTRSDMRGYISGTAFFENGSEFHFREFIDLTQNEPRLMYAYHFQSSDQQLVFRYDNAPHRPELPTPDHKHIYQEVISLDSPPDFKQVFEDILLQII